MKKFIEKLKSKQNLSFNESKDAFEMLMLGKVSDDEIFDFLTLLSAKGEVSDEIAGGVYVLRDKSKRVNVKDCIDTCGTGGDGRFAQILKRDNKKLNISSSEALPSINISKASLLSLKDKFFLLFSFSINFFISSYN